MRTLLTTMLLVSSSLLQAQKIDVKDDIVTVDGVPYCRIEKIRGGGDWDFKVHSNSGNALIHLKGREYFDPSQVNNGNPKGRIFYYEWTFLGSDGKAETRGMTQKALAKKLYNAGLIEGDTVPAAAEKNFLSVEGTSHSQRQAQLGQPVIIIQR